MNNFLISLSLSRCELHEGDADICLVYHKQSISQRQIIVSEAKDWEPPAPYVWVACVCLVTQSSLTLCDPTDSSPSGFSVHEDSPGKNAEMGCNFLLQRIFPTQGSNPGQTHCSQVLHHLGHQGMSSPKLEGFWGGASGKEPTCQCRRYKKQGFNPWVRKIFWRRKWT